MSLRSIQNRTRHEAMTRSGAVVAFDYDIGMWFGVLTGMKALFILSADSLLSALRNSIIKDNTTTKEGLLKHEVAFGDTPQSVLTKPSKHDSTQWFGARMIKAAAIKVLPFYLGCFTPSSILAHIIIGGT